MLRDRINLAVVYHKSLLRVLFRNEGGAGNAAVRVNNDLVGLQVGNMLLQFLFLLQSHGKRLAVETVVSLKID